MLVSSGQVLNEAEWTLIGVLGVAREEGHTSRKYLVAGNRALRIFNFSLPILSLDLIDLHC